MEENRFDPLQFIGFLLISGILMFWFYDNQSNMIENQEQIVDDSQIEVVEQPTNIVDSSYNDYKDNDEFSEEIIVILKDSKGDPKKNRLTINIDLNLFDLNDNLKSSQNFYESFEYSIDDNKFNLKQYEKNIKQNLVEEISQQINAFLAQVI